MIRNEQELIEKVRLGESVALEYLYRNEFNKVRSLIESSGGVLDDAKDVFQEALIQLIRNLNEGNFMGQSKLTTYLYSIAKFKWLNVARDKKRRKTESIESNMNSKLKVISLQDDDESAKKESEEQAIRELISKMGEECKKLLKLFYFFKKSMKEIAREMNYTEGFVRVKKNRCMKELREKAINHKLFNEN